MAWDRIIPGSTLTTASANYFTAKYLTNGIVFHLCNTSADTVTFSIWVVPPKGAAAVSNQIYSNESLQPYQGMPFFCKQILLKDYTILALASAGDVVSFSAGGLVNT